MTNRQRGYSSKSNTAPVWVQTALAILVILFLFIIAVTIFRSRANSKEEKQIPTSDDMVEELVQDASSESAMRVKETSRGIPDNTELADVSGGAASAVSKRIFENGFFTHTILANGMPAIDTGKFHYQAWLVRPYPFDFFETSEMSLNADGSWGMIWVGESGETYDEFVDVLITLEPNDDFDDNPSAEQVLKGSFR